MPDNISNCGDCTAPPQTITSRRAVSRRDARRRQQINADRAAVLDADPRDRACRSAG